MEYTVEEKNRIIQCFNSISKRKEEKPYNSISTIHKNLSSVIDSISLGNELLDRISHASNQVLDLDRDLEKVLVDIKSEVGVMHD